MDENERKHDLDLPLLSNIEDIRIAHYCIELACDLNSKMFTGSVILLLVPVDFIENKGDVSQCTEATTVDGPEIKGDVSHCTEVTAVDGLKHGETTKNQHCTEINNTYEREDITFSEGSHITEKHIVVTNCDRLETVQGCTVSADTDQEFDISTRTVQRSTHSFIQRVTETEGGSVDVKRKETEIEQPVITTSQYNHDNKPESSDSMLRRTDPEDFGQNISFNASDANLRTVSCDHSYTNTFLENGEVYQTHVPNNNSAELIMKEIPKIHPDFIVVLDAWDLTVISVQETSICSDFDVASDRDKARLKELVETCDKSPLEFHTEKTCLKFWKPGTKSAKHFPRCIRIWYQTQTCGPSLKWTKDQDGRPCVYTHGHWINNRSLFPSQDVPGALATWRAYIHVPEGMTVLMSGDQDPVINLPLPGTNVVTYIFHTELEVPSSTLALAAGYWEEVQIIPPKRSTLDNLSGQLPCRLFTPGFHKDFAISLLSSYIPRCMKAAVSLLGAHPFKRLDILIVPASFASLGMASPSLMFLSQSVLSRGGHMLVRVAHELSHSWFGLAIGPRDWHEEWLSEGFCTYTESVIHARAIELTEDEFKEEREIYDHLKYRLLQAELQSTGDHLQTLRNAEGDDTGVKYVSNGMNPDKGFLQLHYLKGYFLLRYLEETVGYNNFHGFLKTLVETFHHSLIDSMDVIKLFFKTFPNKRSSSLSEDSIFQDWLNYPGLPKISGEGVLKYSKLVDEVTKLEKKVCDCNDIWTKLHWRKRRKLDINFKLQIPELKQVQVLVLLDRLLEVKKLQHSILNHLNEKLELSTSNADVRHKWCELVIKHRLQDRYKDVGHFLIHHQAMGVYLFGELIISRDRDQRHLAEEHFAAISDDMEDGVKKVVQGMVYGN